MNFRDHFLPRWILAHVLGWTIGLYLGFWNPICFLGAGVIAGLTLGFAQWWVLSRPSPPLISLDLQGGRPEGRP